MQTRRIFLTTTLAATGLAALPLRAAEFEITLTDAEWKKRLTPAQFAVLRQDVTEKAFSNTLMGEKSPLLKEARSGTYHCAGCDLPVYPSKTKFDSGTGWPSFYASLPDAVGTKEDSTLFTTRLEVHCRRCGGHLGHIFNDGPKPTGKRHCLNGLAMTFTAA
ncbi:peptide-methionine (R)-S-oxide reductase MsrB [Pseudorhodobacter sp.]|uniref:peptide-methionine (R)-S-oxide reductase MsrB n=1 Tax=Pseudorhodobacter sp. TaxID=1934400 RepID=UPI002648A5E2|nr:peptide-methionine (R)-S-oxide reductase MsrB [Pseudorhodobacter sp.]MDN5788273.1 peptide-methionine (R)-S-oxide reductase MsrB [Pseudorhodobacter sp.]